MKRIFLCMMAAAAMLAAPSCIKNDEPAGIEEMRKGKAELLKAEALVQQAEAKIKEAEAKVQEAYAAQEEAIARKLAAVAQLKELEVEMQQARNEEEKARIAKRMTEIESETALAVEKAKQDLLAAQYETAAIEAQYEAAMAQLEVWIMNNGAESVYAAELKEVIGKLNTAREGIVAAQKNIAAATTELYDATVDEKAWVRGQQKEIAVKKEKIALYNDAIAYWSALSEANEVKWGAELEAMKQKREEAYPKYVELQKAYDEKQAAIDKMKTEKEDKGKVFTSEFNHKYARIFADINEKRKAAQEPATGRFELEISVPEQLRNAVGDAFSTKGWNWSDDKKSFVYNEERIDIYAGDIADMLLQNDDNDESVAGLIHDLRRMIYTPTDLANAQQRLAAMKVEADEVQAAYDKDLKAFNEALAAFSKAAEAYKFDWTNTRQKTLRNEVIAQVGKFYEELAEKVAEEADYKPAAAEMKAVATTVAEYIKVRNAFDGVFDTELTLTGADNKEVKMLLSAYIVSSAEVIEAYVVGDKRSDFEAIWTAAEVDFAAEKSVTAKLAAAANKAYGIDGLLLHEIKAEDLKMIQNTYNIDFINPIKEVYPLGGGRPMYVYTLERGSLFEAMQVANEMKDLKAQIEGQDEIETIIAAAEKYYEEYSKIVETVKEAVKAVAAERKAAEEAQADEQKAFFKEQEAEQKKINDAEDDLKSDAIAVEIAKNEYEMYESNIARIERYISMGAGYDENGQWIEKEETIVEGIKKNIKTYVEGLTDRVADLNDELEKAENLLKTYEETGFTADLQSEHLAMIQARIEGYKENLAQAQREFDKLVEQKDQLLALMKNE